MKAGSISRWVVALVFLVGQWIAVVHATQHELIEHGTGICHVCAIAHAAPVPPSSTIVPAQAIADVAPAAPSMIGLIDRRPFRRANNRAPPLLLV